MSISLSEALSLLPAGKRNNAKDYSGYSLTWLPLAANAASTKATVTTQDDSDFMALVLTAEVTDNATPPVTIANPQMTLDLRTGDRSLFPDQIQVHIKNITARADQGGGGFPLPFPIWVPRNTTLQGFMSNLTAVVSNIRITLHGVRVYDRKAASSSLQG